MLVKALTDDMLNAIAYHTPETSLLRAELVCTRWRSAIRNGSVGSAYRRFVVRRGNAVPLARREDDEWIWHSTLPLKGC